MSEIKVSVIMAVYNGEKYLQQALNTLSSQTLKEIEIICVDDGSNDESLSLLKRHARSESKMHVLQNNKRTEGAGEARNIGIRAAKGEYLAFVDSDDFFSPEMLENSYKKAKELNVDVLMFDSWYFDEDQQVAYESTSPINDLFLPHLEVFKPKDNVNGIFRMTHGASWARLFRRSFITEKKITFFDSNFWEDACMVYTAICEAERIGVLHEKLMYYRYNHSRSQTSRRNRYALSGIKAMIELKRRFDERGLTEQFRVPLINECISRAFAMFDCVTDIDSFERIFDYLKAVGIELLGAYDIDDSEYYNGKHPNYREALIKATTPLEYLITRNVFTDNSRRPVFDIEFAKYAKGNGRIVVYGAGACGRKAFIKLMGSMRYKLCGWVDKKHSIMGYPVQSPETLRNLDFEFVLIAIESESVAEEVSAYLRAMDIKEKQIIWMPNIALCV